MATGDFVPADFDPPTSLVTDRIRLLDPRDDDVIGCVYLYPSTSQEWDVSVQSWVRADRSELDGPLADAVAGWVASHWPWTRVDRCGR